MVIVPWVINPYTGELVYEEVRSDPPEGSYEVKNLYVKDGKLVVEYVE